MDTQAQPDLVSDEEALRFLATEGWLPLILGDHDDLAAAYSALQVKAAEFFALPDHSDAKTRFHAVKVAQASECGYSHIEQEKSIMTLRTAAGCPESLVSYARQAWKMTGSFLENILESIASSLDLHKDVFEPLVAPCRVLPDEIETPTFMRLFRYERPSGAMPRINAEAHRDLGLLSLVVGHSPGLYVRRPDSEAWICAEDDSISSPEARSRSWGLSATLLVGQTLSHLTRSQYIAGTHAVVCDPVSAESKHGAYRYSMVFTLRAAEVPIYTASFESARTGVFAACHRSEGENARNLFQRFQESHYNVNAAPEVRLLQKKAQKRTLA